MPAIPPYIIEPIFEQFAALLPEREVDHPLGCHRSRRGASVSEKNKAMVRRMVEGINAGDVEGTVDELFAPRAARRVKRLFAEFYAAFPDWREEIVELVAEGHTVAGRFRCSGTHRDELLGEPPTGRRMEVEEVFFLRAEDGKFVKFWALEDSLGRMRQLELVPSPKRSE
jgi:predicted ester cyclase